MSIIVDWPLLGSFFFLLLFLTAVLVVVLWQRWKFRSMLPMKERHPYTQSMMIILCYLLAIGWGACALLSQKEEDGGAHFLSYSGLVLCLAFGHYASLNVYLYRVWLLYYKCKLQIECEKLERSQESLIEGTIRNPTWSVGSGSFRQKEISNKNEQKEQLLRWPTPQSVRSSWIVRYSESFGRRVVTRAFWLLVFICGCNFVFWTIRSRERHKSLNWSPNELADEFFTACAQLMCLAVLFIFPGDDLFWIKIELRLIFFFSTLEIVLYWTFLYRLGAPEAYLSRTICVFFIMLAIAWSNWRAVRSESWCIADSFRQGRSFQALDSSSDIELTMTDILEREDYFQAFERHLKREFSLENLNFIAAVVQHRQLCQTLTDTRQNRKSIIIVGKDTTPNTQSISIKPLCVSINGKYADSSNSSYVSTPATPTPGVLRGGMDSLSCKSPQNGRSPTYRKNTDREVITRTPRLNGIKSSMETCLDERETASFIFSEYCDLGSPQEINLGMRDRDELVEFFSRSVVYPDELTTIFDSAFDSVLDLLANDSLRRFKRHCRFHKLIKN